MPYFSKDIDIEKVSVSNKVSFWWKSCKYIFGYLFNGHKFKPLHIMLPKRSVYVKSYDLQTKEMYFLIEYDE